MDSEESEAATIEMVGQIKFVAYSVIAYIIVGMGLLGNLLNLVILTRPNLKVKQQIVYKFPSRMFIQPSMNYIFNPKGAEGGGGSQTHINVGPTAIIPFSLVDCCFFF